MLRLESRDRGEKHAVRRVNRLFRPPPLKREVVAARLGHAATVRAGAILVGCRARPERLRRGKRTSATPRSVRPGTLHLPDGSEARQAPQGQARGGPTCSTVRLPFGRPTVGYDDAGKVRRPTAMLGGDLAGTVDTDGHQALSDSAERPQRLRRSPTPRVPVPVRWPTVRSSGTPARIRVPSIASGSLLAAPISRWLHGGTPGDPLPRPKLACVACR